MKTHFWESLYIYIETIQIWKHVVSNSCTLEDILKSSGSYTCGTKPVLRASTSCHDLFRSVTRKTFDMITEVKLK
jgi:hypothetical protein